MVAKEWRISDKSPSDEAVIIFLFPNYEAERGYQVSERYHFVTSPLLASGEQRKSQTEGEGSGNPNKWASATKRILMLSALATLHQYRCEEALLMQ